LNFAVRQPGLVNDKYKKKEVLYDSIFFEKIILSLLHKVKFLIVATKAPKHKITQKTGYLCNKIL
jgi:hypothetical protein